MKTSRLICLMTAMAIAPASALRAQSSLSQTPKPGQTPSGGPTPYSSQLSNKTPGLSSASGGLGTPKPKFVLGGGTLDRKGGPGEATHFWHEVVEVGQGYLILKRNDKFVKVINVPANNRAAVGKSVRIKVTRNFVPTRHKLPDGTLGILDTFTALAAPE